VIPPLKSSKIRAACQLYGGVLTPHAEYTLDGSLLRLRLGSIRELIGKLHRYLTRMSAKAI